MDREQVLMIMKILKVAYPRFYTDMNKEDAESTIQLWCEMFKNENPRLVVGAVKNLINHFKYPPTIADVKEEMRKATEYRELDSTETWVMVRTAISNSAYHSAEEFAKLPKIAQKIVGTPEQLKYWAISNEYNEGVTKGQFLKQFDTMKQREKEEQNMLPEYKRLIENLFCENEIKLIGTKEE